MLVPYVVGFGNQKLLNALLNKRIYSYKRIANYHVWMNRLYSVKWVGLYCFLLYILMEKKHIVGIRTIKQYLWSTKKITWSALIHQDKTSALSPCDHICSGKIMEWRRCLRLSHPLMSTPARNCALCCCTTAGDLTDSCQGPDVQSGSSSGMCQHFTAAHPEAQWFHEVLSREQVVPWLWYTAGQLVLWATFSFCHQYISRLGQEY